MRTGYFILLLFVFTVKFNSCQSDSSEMPQFSDDSLLLKSDMENEAFLIEMSDATELMADKAFEFRNAISCGIKGVYMYSKTIDKYKDNPEKLAARITLLGITDVYLSVNSGTIKKSASWYRSFNKELHNNNIRVHALRLENLNMYVDDDMARSYTRQIIDFNTSASPEERFDGISADLEPHILKPSYSNLPNGLEIFWGEDGIGKSNDLLLKRTVDILEIAKSACETLPLSQSLGFFFQKRVNDGLFQYGSTADFLGQCEHVLVMAYNHKMQEIWYRANLSLEKVNHLYPNSVVIAINTKGSSDPQTTLKPKGWDYTMETLRYLSRKGSANPAYKGICIFEYHEFEQMWEWLQDTM